MIGYEEVKNRKWYYLEVPDVYDAWSGKGLQIHPRRTLLKLNHK